MATAVLSSSVALGKLSKRCFVSTIKLLAKPPDGMAGSIHVKPSQDLFILQVYLWTTMLDSVSIRNQWVSVLNLNPYHQKKKLVCDKKKQSEFVISVLKLCSLKKWLYSLILRRIFVRQTSALFTVVTYFIRIWYNKHGLLRFICTMASLRCSYPGIMGR